MTVTFRACCAGYLDRVTSVERSAEVPARDRPTLTCYPDGPVLIRGDVDVLGPDGEILPRRRRTVALCRCGHSALGVWCDGTHKLLRGRAGRRRGVPDPEADA